MRKFQYVVTIDVDDEYFLSDEQMVEDFKKLEGVGGPDLVYSLAEARFSSAVTDVLHQNMGSAGKTRISTTFAGEVK